MLYHEITVRKGEHMLQPDIIKTSLDYIERNLKTDIAAEELARMANYSLYHYYRLFSAVMGSSVAEYIKKRRLDHALAEIAGGRKAVDVVLEYGFDTYAGFYKAFTRMYGCSPRKYLSIYSGHRPKKPEVKIIRSKKELRELLDNWELPKDIALGDVPIMDGRGISDTAWTVGDGFLLKTGERNKLLKEIRIAGALDREGFVSSTPVTTRTGEQYLDGREIFVLTRRLRGSPLPKGDRVGDNYAEFAERYGAGLARLHRALKRVQSGVLPDEADLFKIVTNWALPKFRQLNGQWGLGLTEAFFTDYLERFGALQDKLPRQLIHRNPHPGVILFENGEISGFTEFDLSEVNVRLWDVCYCATGLMSETDEENYTRWLDVFAAILRGYDKESRLTSEEKEALFHVVSSVEMIFAAYMDTRDELRPLLDINLKMFAFIVRHRDRIERIF